MSILAVADTHAVIWYSYDDLRLGPSARSIIEEIRRTGDHIAVSSITLAEIVYLAEKGRIPIETVNPLTAQLMNAVSILVDVPFDRSLAEIMQRVSRAQVPDFPDRIICATALHLGVPLISRDRRITASDVQTLW